MGARELSRDAGPEIDAAKNGAELGEGAPAPAPGAAAAAAGPVVSSIPPRRRSSAPPRGSAPAHASAPATARTETVPTREQRVIALLERVAHGRFVYQDGRAWLLREADSVVADTPLLAAYALLTDLQ